MKKTWLIRIIVILVLIGLIILLTTTKKEVAPGYCVSDSDCVPASCCHPNSCVAKEQAPNCKGILCSQVCEPGTLDCMQGSCKCVNSKCTVTSGKEACLTDKDCICGGVDTLTGKCFVGNLGYYENYVDNKRSCQDFCTGIAGNLETKCINNKCGLISKE